MPRPRTVSFDPRRVQLPELRRRARRAAALLAASDAAWGRTGEADWRGSFAHHPRIGGKDALRDKFAATRAWAKREQSGAAAASEAVLDALAAGNAAYEKKFGHIFIVCATGKSAAEQNKITKIRLEKLIP